MNPRTRFLVPVFLILLLSSIPTLCEPPQDPAGATASATGEKGALPPAAPTPRAALTAPRLPVTNGLTVSEPKIFEERSLRLMLRAAEQRLESMGVIDAASVTGAIGTSQGGEESFSDISLSAGTLPTPQVVTDVTNTQSATPSTVTKTTTTEAPVTPGVPTATEFPAEFGSSLGLQPSFGFSARDRLAEQLALTFQIANLRLALERAASDRFITGTSYGGRSYSFQRQPVLVGFQVSLDNSSKYRDAVAEVRVALRLPGGEPISLVTLLPTKDTYNVATITRKSSSIGAGAIINVFQVGAGLRRGRGTYYLVQDADTLGLEFPDNDPDMLTFGWQFRPVLGRRAVDSGLRQVYALITLPPANWFPDGSIVQGTIETRWRKWDRRRRTVGPEIHGSPEAREVQISSRLFSNIETNLKPSIKNVEWVDLGADRALVVVEGLNFFPDTQVAVGDSVLDRSSGLQIPDEGRLVFATSLKALAASRDVSIVGRYLGRTPLVIPGAAGAQATVQLKGFEYVGSEVVRISLTAEGFGANPRPVVVVGDAVFGGRERPLKVLRGDRGVITGFELEAPLSVVRASRRLVARDLFGGEGLLAELPLVLEGDFSATRVVTLAKQEEGPVLGIIGSGFDTKMVVDVAGKEVAGTPVGQQPSSLFTFIPTWEQIRGVEQIVVRRKEGQAPPVLLSLKPSPEVKKPKLPESTQVAQGFSQLKSFPGTDLESIKTVVFEKQELKHKIDEKGTALEIHLTTQVTGAPGPKALELHLIDGSIVFLPLEVTKS